MDTIVVSCRCGQSMRATDAQRAKSGRCPRCAGTVWVPNQHANCARCSRPFQRLWDQNQTQEGVVCHICANQFRNPGTPPVLEATFDISKVLSEERRAANEEPARETPEKRSKVWGPVLFLGIGALVVGAILLLPEFSIDSRILTLAPDPEQISAQTLVSAMALRFLCAVAFWVGVLYAVLNFANALPSPRMRDNLLVLVCVASLFQVMSAFAGFNLYVLLFMVVLQLKILDYLFDLELRHMLLLVFVYAMAAPVYLLSETVLLNIFLTYAPA